MLLGGAVVWWVLVLALPALSLSPHYHVFADQRRLLGLPHAADVLSNALFALFGIWGLIRIWLASRQGHTDSVLDAELAHRRPVMAALFCVGLILTSLGSAYYHLAPDMGSLMWDRLGMSVSFAGLLAWAIEERVSDRAADWSAVALLIAGPLSVLWGTWHGNQMPWVLLQIAGLIALTLLSMQPTRWICPGVAWWLGVLLYLAAKVLEWGDHAVFGFSAHVVSGHSLKHLIAAMAAFPLVLSMPPMQTLGAQPEALACL